MGGLAQFVEQHQIDYLFGCASVSMRDGRAQAAIMSTVSGVLYLKKLKACHEFVMTCA